MRPGTVRAVLLACLLAVLAAVLGAGTANAQATATTPVPRVVVVGISGLRWSDVSPAATPTLWRLGRPGLGGVAGGLRGEAAGLPANAWLTLNAGPGAVRPHQRRLRGVSRGCCFRPWSRGPGHGLAGDLQQPVPQQPQLGPAGVPDPGLRHRRRPGGRAGAGRLRRARRVLPVLGRGPHRRGAGPLPADRGGPGKHRECRTVCGPRLGGRRTRPHRGGPAGSTLLVTAPGATAQPRTCSLPWPSAPVTRLACWMPPPPGSRAWWCSPT